MGDLDALAASIADVGLLQPIVVKPDGTLVAGQRRLEACKRLGWDDVPVHVVCTASDALKALKAERDENTCRKDFTPSEAVAVAEAIEPLERQAARERLAVRSEKFSEVNAKGNALDFTAAAVGMSRPTLQKAREVVAAAEREPERYEPIREQMDRTGKVDGAYKQLVTTRQAVHFSSQSCEWYSPAVIVDRVQAVMGKIDLDPCSNSRETPSVPAATHYTAEDDGLAQEWRGKVYMNPPYGDVIGDWVRRLVGEYEAGRVSEAVALLPARTDTQWFRTLKQYPRCFVWGRLRFSGMDNSAPFPSMVVYLGKATMTFAEVFSDIGDTYELTR
jgi:ParB family chromosome partitioning protein